MPNYVYKTITTGTSYTPTNDNEFITINLDLEAITTGVFFVNLPVAIGTTQKNYIIRVIADTAIDGNGVKIVVNPDSTGLAGNINSGLYYWLNRKYNSVSLTSITTENTYSTTAFTM